MSSLMILSPIRSPESVRDMVEISQYLSACDGDSIRKSCDTDVEFIGSAPRNRIAMGVA